MRGKKEVRYIVSRLKNPDDLEGERERIGCHPYLELAKNHADRTAPGTFVDAEGGTYYSDGPYGRRTGWEVEWTNRNLYQGRKKRNPVPQAVPRRIPGRPEPASVSVMTLWMRRLYSHTVTLPWVGRHKSFGH